MLASRAVETFVVLTTVPDVGAAQVAREALAEAGIEVELRRRGIDAYFGSLTPGDYEVRVAQNHHDAARSVLDQLAAEAAEAATRESMDVPEVILPPEQVPNLRPRFTAWRTVAVTAAVAMLLAAGGAYYIFYAVMRATD